MGGALPFPTGPPTKLRQRTSQRRGKATEQTMCPGAEGSGDPRATCPSEGKFSRLPLRALPQDWEWEQNRERMGERRKRSEGKRSSQKQVKEKLMCFEEATH